MDPKKQKLNPELKEIYDRVMNTQINNHVPPESTTPPTAGVHSAPQNPSIPPPSQPAPSTAVSPPAGGSQPGSFAPAGAGAQSAPFVFTGNKVITPQEQHASQTQTYSASSKKISGPIIVTLVVILIVMWTLFWTKFFGLF